MYFDFGGSDFMSFSTFSQMPCQKKEGKMFPSEPNQGRQTKTVLGSGDLLYSCSGEIVKNAVEYISCDLSSKLLILFCDEHIEKQPECPKLGFSEEVTCALQQSLRFYMLQSTI